VHFNKIDLSQATLDAIASVKKYIPSYGDVPNNLSNVQNCVYLRYFLGVAFCLVQWTFLCYADRFAISIDFRDRFKS
jgi:hypothetical protein